MEDQMNQPGAVQPAPQKPKRPAKSQRKVGKFYTIEEANTFAASMCAMSDETTSTDPMQLALAGIERALFSHGDESRSGLRDRPADTAVVADEEPAPLRLRLEALVVIGAATARVLDAPLVAPLMLAQDLPGLPGWKARRRGDALYVLIEGLGTVIGVPVPHLQPAPFKLSRA